MQLAETSNTGPPSSSDGRGHDVTVHAPAVICVQILTLKRSEVAHAVDQGVTLVKVRHSRQRRGNYPMARTSGIIAA